MILHLGVVDQPYDNRQQMAAADIYARLKAGKPPKRHEVRGAVTTGDVAEILEARYDVMGHFFDRHKDEIAAMVAETLLDDFVSGVSGGSNTLGTVTGKIGELFKDFITTAEIEKMGVPGVPTKAALRGVNHRLKHPYAKDNPRRPSFIDTGLYEGSFAAWGD